MYKLTTMAFFMLAFLLTACGGEPVTILAQTHEKEDIQSPAQTHTENSGMPERIEKTEEEWCTILTEEQYRVLREKGTERAFTGALLKNDQRGVYACAGCDTELFHSDHKFDSGTGWPSYFQPFENTNIATKEDRSHGMSRTEVLCAHCGGHLGHLFPDGPEPTGMRYCINSVSLKFVSEAGAEE